MRKPILNDNDNNIYLRSLVGSPRNLFRPSSFYDALGRELEKKNILRTECAGTVVYRSFCWVGKLRNVLLRPFYPPSATGQSLSSVMPHTTRKM